MIPDRRRRASSTICMRSAAPGTVVWAVTTADGILLIDAGYPDELESVLLPQMRAAGLDADDAWYGLVGHGHADHFGGASYFQERGARVALSAADWDLVEAPPAPGAPPSPAGLPPPRRDVVVADGAPIVFGGLTITPVLIPGHTPGALGFVLEVADGGRTHMAGLFGGSILLSNRISDEGLRQYVESLERFAAVTAPARCRRRDPESSALRRFRTQAGGARAARCRRRPSIRRGPRRISALSDRHARVRERAARAPLTASESARRRRGSRQCLPWRLGRLNVSFMNGWARDPEQKPLRSKLDEVTEIGADVGCGTRSAEVVLQMHERSSELRATAVGFMRC